MVKLSQHLTVNNDEKFLFLYGNVTQSESYGLAVKTKFFLCKNKRDSI